MTKRLKGMLLAAVLAAALAARADEDVRWYDSEQRLLWGYTVVNGEATISTPGFGDSNARDVCKGATSSCLRGSVPTGRTGRRRIRCATWRRGSSGTAQR